MDNKIIDFNKHYLNRITDQHLDYLEFESNENNPDCLRCAVEIIFTHPIDDDDCEKMLDFYKDYLDKIYKKFIRR